MGKDRGMPVGLCGRSGSGKGYVSALFAKEGIPAVDTDAVYRGMTGPCEQLSPCMEELVKRFGEQILSPDRSLNRAVMRSLVFGGDRQALADLNAITHKYILEQTNAEAEEWYRKGCPIVLIDAPLLYESGFDAMCACTVCVSAPEDVIVERIMKRDSISEEDAKRRLATQKSVAELEGRSDFVLMNDCEKDELIRRVRACAEELRRIRRAWDEEDV